MIKPSQATPLDVRLEADQSLELVHQSGERLMSISGLAYRGALIQTEQYKDVHVMEFGGGPPLLLVHGAGGGGAVWHRQIAALAQSFRVVVPDLPMFGLSAIPSSFGTIRADAGSFVLQLMDRLGIASAHIVGHSLGGLTALGALTQAPHRFEKVAIVGSAGLGPEIPWAYKAVTVPFFGEIVTIPNRPLLRSFFFRYESNFTDETEEVSALIDYIYRVIARRGRHRQLLRGLRLFSSIRGQRDILTDSELTAIQNPVLALWGDHDRYFPRSHYRRVLTKVPRAQGVLIPRCGHMPGVDAPERYTEILMDWFTCD